MTSLPLMRKTGSTTWRLMTFGLIVLMLTLLPYLALFGSVVGFPPPRVDQATRADYAELVSRAFPDLDALPDYPGLKATPAKVSECAFSDGDLFDDGAFKEWEAKDEVDPFDGVPSWGPAVSDMEVRLRGMGWRDLGEHEFAKTFGGESISLTIFAESMSPYGMAIEPDHWDRHVCETWAGTPAQS